MKYTGPLFGKHGRHFVPLIMTSEQVDAICEDRLNLLQMIQRCELWLSTHPEGRAMQINCQEVIIKSKEADP